MLTQINRVKPIKLWEFLGRIKSNRYLTIVKVHWKKQEEVLIRARPWEIIENKRFYKEWKDLYVCELLISRDADNLIVEEDSND